jgi:hypothetical protein
MGPTATLYSRTVDRIGGYLGHPHAVAWGEFDEGPIVPGYLDADVDALPPIGSRLILKPLPISVGGTDTVTYTYSVVNDA